MSDVFPNILPLLAEKKTLNSRKYVDMPFVQAFFSVCEDILDREVPPDLCW